jgi:arsenate reductase (thioredoxin)
MSDKRRVLILCTGNSARSQMAEGWLRARAGNRFDVFSAGSVPSGTVHPAAITVMGELGIDISGHISKNMLNYIDKSFDYVLTVCDHAAESCPIFPGGGKRIHRDFPDPSFAPEAERLAAFRRTRDDIAAWLGELFDI